MWLTIQMTTESCCSPELSPTTNKGVTIVMVARIAEVVPAIHTHDVQVPSVLRFRWSLPHAHVYSIVYGPEY